ncbi:MAG: AraC family transcriptional regulator [Gammaproteobacteria bacterium SG8_11]|nr:MAG: AraC family transcriptional regulator [Gammaproteobacteria bacterium SG8_11]
MLRNLALIQGLVDRIEENLAEEINIISLAESFGMSPWHFQRLFKSLVGDTLGGYMRGRRLTKAAQLLLNSELGIIDVAFSVGFNSHEAFTRSFKSYFKVSPKSFRKNKPTILLCEKPLLTMELFDHLSQGIEREPTIRQKNEQIIVGFDTTIPSPFVSNENYCDLLYTPWTTLLERQTEVQNRIPKTFYGLTVSRSGTFTEDTLDYIAGVPVTDLGHIPGGMVTYKFPQQFVAMFEVFSGTEDTVAKTVDYIYGYWLPNSPYTRGHGNDYELFENVSSFEVPNLRSKYVIPIEPKK